MNTVRRSILAIALSAGLAFTGATAHAQAGGHPYAVRVDPARSDAVARVLAKIAMPRRIAVAESQSVAELLKSECHRPEIGGWQVVTSADKRTLEFPPCILKGAKESFSVREGDTAEGIAKKFGLHPSSSARLKLENGQLDLGLKIFPGQIVMVPEVPRWTPFEVASDVADRAGVVRAIAEELNCGNEPAEACLLRNSVVLIDREPDGYKEAPTGQQKLDLLSFGETDGPVSRSSAVASGQWPYDRARVAAILSSSIVQQMKIERSVIGVADNGLADGIGKPLPRAAYVDPNPFDWISNYHPEASDSVGGGVGRDQEADFDNSVALCADLPTPNFATWRTLEAASHGAIVASIAFGLDLFDDLQKRADALPQVAFYRLIRNACDENALLSPKDELALMQAFETLSRRYEFISLSYSISAPNMNSFAAVARNTLDSDWKLLFVPAGNAGIRARDLACPACLADPDRYGKASRRVMVIGAATNELKIAPYSGGGQFVRLYAPGEPSGALNIAGGSASYTGAATSFAVPRVAFAAATMRALGVSKLAGVKHRLLLASWPLLDDFGHPRADGARVLDLTKALAVPFYSVEARVFENGREVRKTYVGRLVGRIEDLPICASVISPRKYQALLFGEAVEGAVEVQGYQRDIDLGDQLYSDQLRGCRPTGMLTLDDLVDGVIKIPLDKVTSILFPW